MNSKARTDEKMPVPAVNVDYVRDILVTRCGYARELVQDDYQFATGKSVDLAAFAYKPFDARSACIALFNCQTNEPKTEVLARREIGAPVVFAKYRDQLQVWKPGRNGAKCIEALTANQIPNFFSERQSDLAPRRIYDAKTIGRLPNGQQQR